MPGTDATAWQKILSVEVLSSLAIGLFLGGVAWAELSKDVAGTDEKASKALTEVSAVKESVHAIETDVAVIKANQGTFKEALKKQEAAQAETNKYLRELIQRN